MHKMSKQSVGWNIFISFMQRKYVVKYFAYNLDDKVPNSKGFQLL